MQPIESFPLPADTEAQSPVKATPQPTEEQFHLSRALRNITQVIGHEQAKLTPYARRALLCVLDETCIADILAMDTAQRYKTEHYVSPGPFDDPDGGERL